MKFLLVIVVLLLAIWLWRTNRPAVPKWHEPKPKAAPEPLAMVSCTLCSVHVPSVDVVPGKKGAYCSAAHLHQAEP
ncbi:PP0621 family protein [Rhodoferax sp. UBA5149]|uniref:PP0621 family protein n=1 Tax=Rhodoferax sp. UBA5149 TaxID=1947379 RepID=UPI0025EC00F3|nr:PP0621 family protein [Rhodoferax sp. UBA5149]